MEVKRSREVDIALGTVFSDSNKLELLSFTTPM